MSWFGWFDEEVDEDDISFFSPLLRGAYEVLFFI